MHNEYPGVITRFLRHDERLILSEEREMPLVLEAEGSSDLVFLRQFLLANANQILADMAKYGAVLLRGFDVTTDEEFEKVVLSIPSFRGIREVFMSENGRIPVDHLNFVLHTNSVYKTGGTLYLGGFHAENYYVTDVPSYICFCCFQPSELGGETGLVNSEKIYRHLHDDLQKKLEKKSFFVCKWSVAEIMQRYQIAQEDVKKVCTQFNLPIVGEGEEQFVLMYKPSVLEHPMTQEKVLHIDLFELPTLNHELRKCFMNDYKGKTWFWHRFFWKLPRFIFNSLEFLAVIFIAFFHSPKDAWKNLYTRIYNFKASRKSKLTSLDTEKVGTCFDDKEVKKLAQLIRNYYSSCLWKKGDVLLIDNKKVLHAGMPGMGPRLIRVMICNPLEMSYQSSDPGLLAARDRATDTIGACMVEGE